MVSRTSDVRARLQSAALELFGDRGYDGTTAAEIAARVGVTERTFFRYFPDKREVLFDSETMIRDALVAGLGRASPTLGPLDALLHAFLAFQPVLERNRSYAKPRHDVIVATPALHERELAKTAALTEALSAALQARGVARLRAVLAAQAGMAAFMQATLAWLDDPEIDFGDELDATFRELRATVARGDREGSADHRADVASFGSAPDHDLPEAISGSAMRDER